MRVKRTDNVVWQCRPMGTYPNANVHCDREEHVVVSSAPGDGYAYSLRLPRKLARLLAKRINQCLDDTAK